MTGLIYSKLLGELERHIDEILKAKDRVLISVVGKGGTGKSYFGKYLRNNGIGKFNKRSISVIDDRVMWLDFLYFFRRRVKLAYNGIDELLPLLNRLSKRKKIIFYMNATPWKRISKADIILILSTNEDLRKKRLYQRYNDDTITLEKALSSEDIDDYQIKHKYLLRAEI